MSLTSLKRWDFAVLKDFVFFSTLLGWFDSFYISQKLVCALSYTVGRYQAGFYKACKGMHGFGFGFGLICFVCVRLVLF